MLFPLEALHIDYAYARSMAAPTRNNNCAYCNMKLCLSKQSEQKTAMVSCTPDRI